MGAEAGREAPKQLPQLEARQTLSSLERRHAANPWLRMMTNRRRGAAPLDGTPRLRRDLRPAWVRVRPRVRVRVRPRPLRSRVSSSKVGKLSINMAMLHLLGRAPFAPCVQVGCKLRATRSWARTEKGQAAAREAFFASPGRKRRPPHRSLQS